MIKTVILLCCVFVSSFTLAADLGYVLPAVGKAEMKRSFQDFLSKSDIIDPLRREFLANRPSDYVLYITHLERSIDQKISDLRKPLTAGSSKARTAQLKQGQELILNQAAMIESALHGSHHPKGLRQTKATQAEQDLMVRGAATVGRVIAYYLLTNCQWDEDFIQEMVEKSIKLVGADNAPGNIPVNKHLNIVNALIRKGAFMALAADFSSKDGKFIMGHDDLSTEKNIDAYIKGTLPYKADCPDKFLQRDDLKKVFAHVTLDRSAPNTMKLNGKTDDTRIQRVVSLLGQQDIKSLEEIYVSDGSKGVTDEGVKGLIPIILGASETLKSFTLQHATMTKKTFVELINMLGRNKKIKSLTLWKCKITPPNSVEKIVIPNKEDDWNLSTLDLSGVDGLSEADIDAFLPYLRVMRNWGAIKFPKAFVAKLDEFKNE